MPADTNPPRKLVNRRATRSTRTPPLAARQSGTSSSDFPEGELADALRSNLLQLLYTRFGERVAEMTSRALGNEPVTPCEVDAILRAAANMSRARRAAFASAGLDAADFLWAERARPRIPDPRHGALLALCAQIVHESAAESDDTRKAAELLHDRVRTYLEKRGQWPILDAHELEAHARPAARMLAAWNAGDAL